MGPLIMLKIEGRFRQEKTGYAETVSIVAALMLGFPIAGMAEEPSTPESWNAHFQSTYVLQHKDGFSAPYSGPQSLLPAPERAYTLSATAYLGARPWRGGEMYLDPEAIQGHTLSSLFGLAGVQNGELQKNSGVVMRGYWARAFVRQTFNLGGEQFRVDEAPNQLASNYGKRRVVLTVGKITQTDLFEKSSYANDPRSQFLNWALITHGAWDYAADARAYTIGVAAELYWDDWAIRSGRFMEPVEANSKYLDYRIMLHHGDQFEVEHDHKIGALPGAVRVLFFRNVANAGSYRDAIDAANLTGGVPDVVSVRKRSTKSGFGLSFEQSVTEDVGVFARGSDCDCKVEEYAFTEIDNIVSAGASIKGSRWSRGNDTVGIAFASNGLNRDHRDYLATGGLGGFLGDGQLPHYARERVVEAYYNLRILKGAYFTLDYQEITNPGYNADRRGPVRILGGRLHFEL